MPFSIFSFPRQQRHLQVGPTNFLHTPRIKNYLQQTPGFLQNFLASTKWKQNKTPLDLSFAFFNIFIFMDKTLALTSAIEYYARLATAKIRSWTRFARPGFLRPKTERDATSTTVSAPSSGSSSNRGKRAMEHGKGKEEEVRVPLSEVVADCVRRWFNETLKEARAGDTGMQVLVGQMYHSGYGVPKNDQKARAWIEKASRYRSSVWKVSDKRPGYNASDSDSDDDKA